MNNRIRFRISKFIRSLITLAIFLLLISTISLVCSYILFSSQPWQKQYQPYGWSIELIRVIILILGNVYLIGFVFKQETKLLIRLRTQKSRLLSLVRSLTILVAILGFILIVIYHLKNGPEYLHQKQPSSGDLWTTYYLPYLLYMPYSLIIYIFIFLPVLSIGLFGVTKDLFKLGKYTNKLIEKLSSYANEIDEIDKDFEERPDNPQGTKDLQDRCEEINHDIKYEFGEFCLKFLDVIGRYPALVLFWAVSVTFEYRIAYLTTSEPARLSTFMAFLVISSVIVLISLGHLYYERAFNQSVRVLYESFRRLANNHSDEHSRFEEQNSIFNFTKRILRRHLGLYIAIIFLSLILPASSIIEAIHKYFK